MKSISLFGLWLVLMLTYASLHAQEPVFSTRKKILEILERQENAWNRGNLKEFMNGYWESDSLLFIGKSGVTRGWNATLANYQNGYPDKNAMGKLTFGVLKMVSLGKSSVLVVGSWRLDREKDVLSGYFSLTWKKIKGTWCIIADHSS